MVRTMLASFRVGHQVAHERLVDLQLRQRQALEIGERGVTGAEVVERETDAERTQRSMRSITASVSSIRLLGQLRA